MRCLCLLVLGAYAFVCVAAVGLTATQSSGQSSSGSGSSSSSGSSTLSSSSSGSSLSSSLSSSGPRCGKGFGNVKCGDVGRAGACCSKDGFCGKLPYHCVTRLGCQSDCNNDLDSSLSESGSSDEVPKAVVPASGAAASGTSRRIIIKTISPAVPLCTTCGSDPTVATASKSVISDLSSSVSSQVLGSNVLAPSDGSSSKLSGQSLANALGSLSVLNQASSGNSAGSSAVNQILAASGSGSSSSLSGSSGSGLSDAIRSNVNSGSLAGASLPGSDSSSAGSGSSLSAGLSANALRLSQQDLDSITQIIRDAGVQATQMIEDAKNHVLRSF